MFRSTRSVTRSAEFWDSSHELTVRWSRSGIEHRMCYWGLERTARASISGVLAACGLHGSRFAGRSTDDSFAEMITGYPLFRGRDNADQLVQIMKIVGTPSEATLAQIKMNSVSTVNGDEMPC